jgi:pimeloyl-ACP methyl ester carboxylesterase
VVFLHGFPEIWYSWRHQMLAVAAAGYRAVAPDWRGYGLSDQPPEAEAASYDDLVEDLLAILDALSIPKVILIFVRIAVASSWVWSWLRKFLVGSCWLSTSVRLVTVSLSDMNYDTAIGNDGWTGTM